MFRHEPWAFPPARVAGEFYPVGTSIAYTDSLLKAATREPVTCGPLLGAWHCELDAPP
jgi:hypothetical protein